VNHDGDRLRRSASRRVGRDGRGLARGTQGAADESEIAENFELPGADLSGEEMTVKVLPKQADEFTCTKCFLVHHRSRLAEQRSTGFVCRDCAA
jgi:hypothetical protein